MIYLVVMLINNFNLYSYPSHIKDKTVVNRLKLPIGVLSQGCSQVAANFPPVVGWQLVTPHYIKI